MDQVSDLSEALPSDVAPNYHIEVCQDPHRYIANSENREKII